MMKFKILIGLLFLCGVSKSQIYTPTNPTIYGHNELRADAFLAQHIPEKATNETNTNKLKAQIFYNTSDSSLWGWSQARSFFKIKGTGGNGVDTVYRKAGFDSVYFRINNVEYAFKDSIGGGGGGGGSQNIEQVLSEGSVLENTHDISGGSGISLYVSTDSILLRSLSTVRIKAGTDIPYLAEFNSDGNINFNNTGADSRIVNFKPSGQVEFYNANTGATLYTIRENGGIISKNSDGDFLFLTDSIGNLYVYNPATSNITFHSSSLGGITVKDGSSDTEIFSVINNGETTFRTEDASELYTERLLIESGSDISKVNIKNSDLHIEKTPDNASVSGTNYMLSWNIDDYKVTKINSVSYKTPVNGYTSSLAVDANQAYVLTEQACQPSGGDPVDEPDHISSFSISLPSITDGDRVKFIIGEVGSPSVSWSDVYSSDLTALPTSFSDNTDLEIVYVECFNKWFIYNISANSSSAVNFLSDSLRAASLIGVNIKNSLGNTAAIFGASGTVTTDLLGRVKMNKDSIDIREMNFALAIDTATNEVDRFNINEVYNDLGIKNIQTMGSTIKATTVPVFTLSTSFTLADNRCYITPIYLKRGTYTGVKWIQSTQGNYTADGYNGMILFSYNGSGTLTALDSTANDGNIWKAASSSTGSKAFANPIIITTSGTYFIGALYNSSAQTTAPVMFASNMGTTVFNTLDFTNSAKLGYVASTNAPTSVAMSGLTNYGLYVNFIGLY